jgi:hypothetical protein
MSAIGTKRTSLVAPHMSAIEGKADIKFYDVRAFGSVPASKASSAVRARCDSGGRV